MSPSLYVGPFRIDLANESLWQGNERLALKPKSFAVLRTLVEHPQQLVTKEALLNTHWGDVSVGDAVLKTCIGEIRQALGDAAGKPKFIATVHRRGYRFVVTPTPTPSTSGQQAAHRLVGRDSELTRLKGWWEEAQQGTRQLIFVTGEPGIGKTSVVNAFLDQLPTSEETWIGHGQCIEQYGAGEAYLPILEALGRLCRQPDGLDLVSCLRQYAPTWLMQLPGLVDQAEMQQLLPSVMGATPVRMIRELADAVEMFTLEHPVVFSFEDLHWLDASSLELLAYVARRSNPARLLIMGTYRPADLILFEHPLKHLKQELLVHGQCQELQLECLTPAAVEDYIQHRLADNHQQIIPSHTIAQFVHQRTEGNPLFMVNILDHLVNHELLVQENEEWRLNDEADTNTIPTGLRQFIDLRVEKLEPQNREVLTIASVAGMDFTAVLLAAGMEESVAAIDDRCHDLTRRGQFIQNCGRTEWPDGTVSTRYAFQHALYQEALYEHLPLARRVDLHRQIGERFEQGYVDRTQEIAAKLALHFERGQEPDRASLYHQQAGEDAFRRSAYQEAILHLTRALELLLTLPSGPDRDQRELALQSLLGMQYLFGKSFGAPEAGVALARAHELCQQYSGNPHWLPILFGLYRYYMTIADINKGGELCQQFDALAKNVGDAETLMIAQASRGVRSMMCGELRIALQYLQPAITHEKGLDPLSLLVKYGEDTRIHGGVFLGWLLWTLGHPDQALTQMQKNLVLQHPFGGPNTRAFILLGNALCHLLRKEYGQALCLAEEILALTQKHGYQQWEMECLMLRGTLKTLQGHPMEAQRDFERRDHILQSMKIYYPFPCTIALFAESLLSCGNHQRGMTIVQEALDFIEQRGVRWFEAEFTRLKGEFTLAVGEPNSEVALKEAESCFQNAIKISQQQEAKMFELRAVMSLCRLWQQQGKNQQARRQLKKVCDWFTEGFETQDLQEAQALLDSLK